MYDCGGRAGTRTPNGFTRRRVQNVVLIQPDPFLFIRPTLFDAVPYTHTVGIQCTGSRLSTRLGKLCTPHIPHHVDFVYLVIPSVFLLLGDDLELMNRGLGLFFPIASSGNS